MKNIDGSVNIVGPLKLDNIIDKKDIDLKKLPIFKFFKDEGGLGYITSGILVTKFESITNASIHRLMVIDSNKLAVRLVPNRHTYILHKKAVSKQKKLPIAILIGADPIITYACSSRVPISKEFQYASSLIGKKINLYTCSNGIDVPLAEIILEGYIDSFEVEPEGPFVDITGKYDICRNEPVIMITKIHHVFNPIYQTIIPSSTEHLLLMGSTYESKILNYVNDVTVAKNVLLTNGGCCYFHAVIQIEKQTEGDGKNAIIAAFSAHNSLKHVVVVDDDIDIYNSSSVEYAIATRFNGKNDLVVINNVKGSTLDPSCNSDGTITKIGIDATKPLSNNSNYDRIIEKNNLF